MKRRPDLPFPGAAPGGDTTAQRGIVVGRYAECTLFGTTTVLANLFDWEVKPVFDYSNLTAHGDYWQVNVFLDAGWTARARGYLTLLGSSYLASALSANIPTSITFNGYSTLANANTPKLLFAGTCFIKDFALMAPMALFEQEINVIGTATPGTLS